MKTLDLIFALRQLAKDPRIAFTYQLILDQAADRLEDLDERIAIMTECNVI